MSYATFLEDFSVENEGNKSRIARNSKEAAVAQTQSSEPLSSADWLTTVLQRPILNSSSRSRNQE
jgi:hypothetical protein